MGKGQTYGDIRIITPTGFLSFPQVFEMALNKNKNKSEFSAAILIPKTIDLGAAAPGSEWGVGQCVRHCLTDSFGATAVEGILANPDNNPIRDGDLKPDYDGYLGHWVIKGTSNYKPHVINSDGTIVQFPNEIDLYSGCQVVLLLSPWTYHHVSGSKGCGFNLLGVKKMGEGKRFATGGISAESVQGAFAAVPTVGAAPPKAPVNW